MKRNKAIDLFAFRAHYLKIDKSLTVREYYSELLKYLEELGMLPPFDQDEFMKDNGYPKNGNRWSPENETV